MKRAIILLIFSLTVNTALAQALFSEGTDYAKLEKVQADGGKQVEVIEFFWYGCSHCNEFEPHISEWKKKRMPKNVKLTLVPAIFNPVWMVHAKAFYAAQAMGVHDKTHQALFDAIHKEKKHFDTIEKLADFFQTLGVDRKKFVDAVNSFAVQTSVQKAKKMVKDYRITGVPTVAINGVYTSGGRQAGSYERLLDIMDFLVVKEAVRRNIKLN